MPLPMGGAVGATSNLLLLAQRRKALQPYLDALTHLKADTLLLAVQGQQDAIERFDPLGHFVVSPLQNPAPTIGIAKEEVTVSSFQEAFKSMAGRTLLLGEPGAGKTTTLIQFARDQLERHIDDPTQPVPVLASLLKWQRNMPLRAWSRRQFPKQIQDYVEDKPTVYLFDGLDELGTERPEDPQNPETSTYDPRQAFLAAIKDELGGEQVVLTCRSLEYASIGVKASLSGAVRLLPLRPQDIERCLVDRGQHALWQTLRHDAALLDLASTPLLLGLLSGAIANSDGTWDLSEARTPAGIFDFYIRSRYEHEAGKASMPLPLETVRSYLEKLAYFLLMEHRMSTSAIEFFPAEAERLLGEDAAVFIQLAIQLHFLRYRTQDELTFIHLKFRDYLALPKLKRLIEDPSASPKTRGLAIERIQFFGDRHVAPIIHQALEDDDPYVRWRAVKASRFVVGEDAVPGLLKALLDSTYRMCKDAAEVLMLIGSDSLIYGLERALHSSDLVVRLWAVHALEEVGSPDATRLLLHAFEDEHSFVRSRAAKALSNVSNASIVSGIAQALRSSRGCVRCQATFVLGEIGGESATQELLLALDDNLSAVRWGAVKALGKIGNRRVVPQLLERLSDSSCNVRWVAVEAVGAIGGARVLPRLREALADKEPEVRRQTVKALGRIGGEKAVAALTDALQDTNAEVRQWAVSTLGKNGSAVVVPELLRVLDDNSWEVRQTAVYWLSEIGGASAIPGLTRAVKDTHKLVRDYAVRGLIEIGGDVAVAGLVEAAKDRDPAIRKMAVRALGNIGSEAAILGLLEIQRNDAFDVHLEVVRALAGIDREMSLKGLINALQSGNELTRRTAALALIQTNSEMAITSILEYFSDPEMMDLVVVRLLNIHRGDPVSRAVELMEHKNPQVRRAAKKALKTIEELL